MLKQWVEAKQSFWKWSKQLNIYIKGFKLAHWAWENTESAEQKLIEHFNINHLILIITNLGPRWNSKHQIYYIRFAKRNPGFFFGYETKNSLLHLEKEVRKIKIIYYIDYHNWANSIVLRD